MSLINLLENKYLIKSALPSIAKIIEKVKKEKQVRLVYGETYDMFGLTVDSLKYYFFLSLLHETLKSMRINVTSTVIIGDLHSVKNKLVVNKNELLKNAEDRIILINKIRNIYKLKFEAVLMSDHVKDKNFQNRLKIIKPIFQSSNELKDLAKKTVLKNRLSQEEENEYQYTLEEVAIITGFDIKIGPPREIYFDQIARSLGSKVNNLSFCGIYLNPTYPLGLNFDYFINHPEIEEFGLTPYKAGSNKLQENRIIIGQSSFEQSKKLIENSFISRNPFLPNPVLDIYLISKMAEYLINSKKELFEVDPVSLIDLKKKTCESLYQNIYKQLILK